MTYESRLRELAEQFSIDDDSLRDILIESGCEEDEVENMDDISSAVTPSVFARACQLIEEVE